MSRQNSAPYARQTAGRRHLTGVVSGTRDDPAAGHQKTLPGHAQARLGCGAGNRPLARERRKRDAARFAGTAQTARRAVHRCSASGMPPDSPELRQRYARRFARATRAAPTRRYRASGKRYAAEIAQAQPARQPGKPRHCAAPPKGWSNRAPSAVLKRIAGLRTAGNGQSDPPPGRAHSPSPIRRSGFSAPWR